MVIEAVRRSTPSDSRPDSRPISRAMPVTPPPPRTSGPETQEVRTFLRPRNNPAVEFYFCPLCASALEPLADGPDAGRPACPSGHFIHYDNPAVTTIGFVEHDGRFLILRRAQEPFHGRWDMPGGFVEAGETPQECLRRELTEETGLQVAELTVIGAYRSRYGDGGRFTVDVAYHARTDSERLSLSDEKSEAAWVSLAEMPTLAFEGEREALADLRRALA